MRYSIIYITAGSLKEAERIAGLLISKRLVACANIFSCKSLFWWDGKVKKQKEFALICKTESRKVEQARAEARKAHSYKVPCIIEIPFFPNKEYGQWISEELR